MNSIYEFLSWYICHIPLPPRGLSNRGKSVLTFAVNRSSISPNAFKYDDGSIQLTVYRVDKTMDQKAARDKCVSHGEDLPHVGRKMLYDVSWPW